MKYDEVMNKTLYRSTDTSMCTFMIDFIKKLKTGMYMRDMMNAVLEHLGVLQVSKVFQLISFFIGNDLDGSE